MGQNDPRTKDQRDRTRDSERIDRERELMPDESPELEDTNLDDTADMGVAAKGSRGTSGSPATPRTATGGAGSTGDRERNEADRNRGGQQTQQPQNNPSGGGGWRESGNTGSQTGSTQGSSQRGVQPRKGE